METWEHLCSIFKSFCFITPQGRVRHRWLVRRVMCMLMKIILASYLKPQKSKSVSMLSACMVN